MPEAIDRQEILDVSESMRNQGGSFCKLLGQALLLADSDNVEKIKATWPEYWNRYLGITRMAREQQC